MVTIIGHETRENSAGEPFVALILQGDITLVQSSESGRFYATAKRTSIPSTFTEEQANVLVGKELPGKVVKVPCEDYDYTIEETGEVITLSHRWEYMPESEPAPLRMVVNNLAA